MGEIWRNCYWNSLVKLEGWECVFHPEVGNLIGKMDFPIVFIGLDYVFPTYEVSESHFLKESNAIRHFYQIHNWSRFCDSNIRICLFWSRPCWDLSLGERCGRLWIDFHTEVKSKIFNKKSKYRKSEHWSCASITGLEDSALGFAPTPLIFAGGPARQPQSAIVSSDHGTLGS